MAIIWDNYIRFTEKTATGNASSAYINKAIYVAYTEGDKEQFVILNGKEELAKIDWLDEKEKTIIEKAFGLGLKTLYLRGAVNEEWGKTGSIEAPNDRILPLESFLLDGLEVESDSIAFTTIMSPRWSAQKKPAGMRGVLVNSIAAIPQTKPAEGTVSVYDPQDENGDYDGKALGIMGVFLAQTIFKSMQFAPINGYSAVTSVGEADTLKNNGITFLFNDGIADMIGMFTVGGKDIKNPYIAELWRYNVRISIKNWMQTKNPNYTDDSILMINELIDKVSENFIALEYFESYQNTVTPLRDGQLPSDIEAFLVNNIQVEYNMVGAIWGTNIITQEGN